MKTTNVKEQVNNLILLINTKEGEERFRQVLDEQLQADSTSELDKAATLQSMREAILTLEPKYRNAALEMLFRLYPEQAASGKHFFVSGTEVCVQQVPDYDYQGDAQEASLAAVVKRQEMRLAASRKKLKGHRESLIAEGKAQLTHMSYRLQIFRN